jgi:hypothetical protein
MTYAQVDLVVERLRALLDVTDQLSSRRKPARNEQRVDLVDGGVSLASAELP